MQFYRLLLVGSLRSTSHLFAATPRDTADSEMEADSNTAVANVDDAEGAESPRSETASALQEAEMAAQKTDVAEARDGDIGQAAALPPPGRREAMVVIRIAIRPDLPGAVRGVCIDLDLHSGFGDVLSVRSRRTVTHLRSARHLQGQMA